VSNKIRQDADSTNCGVGYTRGDCGVHTDTGSKVNIMNENIFYINDSIKP